MHQQSVTRLIHWALYYRSPDDFTREVLRFVDDGLRVGEPVLIMAPGPNIDLLRAAMNGSASRVTFLDTADELRNPARMIPAARRFAQEHPAPRIRVVGQPIWPGRSDAQMREAVRHEACVNILFADLPATVCCPYDAARLDAASLASAGRTHPHSRSDHGYQPASDYLQPAITLADDDAAPPAPARATSWAFGPADLAEVRRLVALRAGEVGLHGDRVADLVLAANEVATNALVYDYGRGMLRMWGDGATFVCEVSNGGGPIDPIAGRVLPTIDAPGGRGLWLANQLCDLVEIRSHAQQVNIRLHTHLT